MSYKINLILLGLILITGKVFSSSDATTTDNTKTNEEIIDSARKKRARKRYKDNVKKKAADAKKRKDQIEAIKNANLEKQKCAQIEAITRKVFMEQDVAANRPKNIDVSVPVGKRGSVPYTNSQNFTV